MDNWTDAPDTNLPPHRGSLILSLGISGIASTGASLLCCQVFGLVGLGVGIAAWIMGSNDIKAMDAGQMEPSGRDSTQAGRICGIVGAGLPVVALLISIALIVFVILADA